MSYAVEFTSDPAAFLAAADDLLAVDPVSTTVERHLGSECAGPLP